jgi:hypothetical protein
LTARRRAIVALALSLLLMAVMLPRTARAETPLVVLVRPPDTDPVALEALNLARGELLADRFRLTVVDDDGDRTGTLVRAERAAGVSLAIGLTVEPRAEAIELWWVDPATGHLVLRRVAAAAGAEGDVSPEVLARRTLEVLRGSLFDLLFERLPHRSEAPAAPRTDRAPERPRWAAELGVSGLTGVDRVGPSLFPLVRGRFAVAPAFAVRATAAWFGTRPIVQAQGGSATVDQGLALLEGVVSFETRTPLRPLLSVGAGVYSVTAEGNAIAPAQNRRTTRAAFAADAGAGLAWRLRPQIDVALEAHALVSAPGLEIDIAGTRAATLGRPTLALTLTLASWI